ncbi:hypothetical protein AB0911_38085, partial [Streptomyces nigra]|uniref:hypothetical protein n=1 Tax=Streptomyces nigra TaxID=1827580 RepID=UPI003456CE8C
MPLTNVQSIALRKIVQKYGLYHHVNENDSEYSPDTYQALIDNGYLERDRTDSTLVAPKTEAEYNYYFNGNFGSYGCLYGSDTKRLTAIEESRANTPIYKWNPHAQAGEPLHEAYLRASVRSEETPILTDKWPVYVNRVMQLIRLSPNAHRDRSDWALLHHVDDDIISGRRAEMEVENYFRGVTMRGKVAEFDPTKHLNHDIFEYLTEEHIVKDLGRRARMLQVAAVRFALDLARDGDYENTRA